jgi:hypothetical protein
MRKSINKTKRLNKYEAREAKRIKIDQASKGTGLYLFVNHTKGELILGKPIIVNGVTVTRIPPGRTFEGDSYFFYLMKANQIRLIKTLEAPKKDEKMNEEKLILDQPDRFTEQGKTEHVVPVKKEKLNENQPDNKKKADVLINEDPMSGVEILLG